MSTITIRRNAFKKIASIIENAKGVIHYSAHMQIDDSYDTQYNVSTTDAALNWLKENQRGARVTLSGNVLRISGPYYFCDEFTIYLDAEEFSADKAAYIDRYAIEQEVCEVEQRAEPVEVFTVTMAANDDVYAVEEVAEKAKSKSFILLEEVEEKYKAWRDLTSLAKGTNTANAH